MLFLRNVGFLLGCSCLVIAQEYPGLAVQGHLLPPLKDLQDTGSTKLGAGLSLAVNIPIEGNVHSGWSHNVMSIRVGLGHDLWPRNTKAAYASVVDVTHLAVDWVFQLRELRGPYVFTGLGLYNWQVKETNTALNQSTSHRTNQLGISLGFGYRITRNLDVELRGIGGRAEPSFATGRAVAAAAWRF